MRTLIKTSALLLVLAVVVGCVSVTPAAKNDRAVIVKDTEKRTCYGFVTAQIPSGKYEPGYRTKDGMYYICPTKIIWGWNPTNGGIFIPDKGNKDQRQAVWLSDLGSTRLFKFQPPLKVDYAGR